MRVVLTLMVTMGDGGNHGQGDHSDGDVHGYGCDDSVVMVVMVWGSYDSS